MATPDRASPLRHIVTALAITGAMSAHGVPVRAAPRDAAAETLRFGDGSESYRGYRIAMAESVPNAEIGRLRRAAEHQVDIVEATGLDGRTKAFLRRFPIVVSAGTGAGSHYSGGGSVSIAVEDAGDERPILLHEYMHVYHLRMLAGGVRNPDILTFYRRARDGALYPPGSYVLSNPREFFAMTASVYLHGRLAREPFTREELRRTQPIYVAYLARLFGAPRAAQP